MDFKAGYFDAVGTAISGSADLTLRIQRDVDLFFYDFNDNTFKAAGHVTLDLAMAEPDAVRAPGWYFGNVPDATILLWDDGVYTTYINCAGVAAPPAWHDIIEFRISDGVRLLESLLTRVPALIDGTQSLQDVLTILLAHVAGGSAKVGNTVTFMRQDGTLKLTRQFTSTAIVSTITP